MGVTDIQINTERLVFVRQLHFKLFQTNISFSGSLNSQARQIGNAVPVLLAEVFGAPHFESYETLLRVGYGEI